MPAQVLDPITITDAMFTACSVAEPAAGETAWVLGATYAVDDLRIYAATHRTYKRLIAGAGAITPDLDTTNWKDNGPTIKWAAFDWYRSTAITAGATLTMTVKPGIITGMAFFGLVGDTLRVVCKNAVSLAVYYDQTFSLSQYLSGDLMWEFYFGNPRQQDVLRINGLYPQDAQVEITLTVSPTTGTAAIGIFAPGQFELIGSPKYGFKAQPIDYSRITVDDDGNTTIRKGLAAKNLMGECFMPSLAEAQAAADVVYRLLGKPCAWMMSDQPQYEYLNAFGLGSAEITTHNARSAKFNLNVRGMI